MNGFWTRCTPVKKVDRHASGTRSRGRWARRSGLTLLEVVAALALMSGVLVTVVVARSTLVAKAARVDRFQKAVKVLEEAVPSWEQAGWPAEPYAVEGFVFRVVDRLDPGLSALGLQVRRYEVRAAEAPTAAALAWIDVFVPMSSPERRQPSPAPGDIL